MFYGSVTSIVHGFRNNDAFLQTKNDVMVISSKGYRMEFPMTVPERITMTSYLRSELTSLLLCTVSEIMLFSREHGDLFAVQINFPSIVYRF